MKPVRLSKRRGEYFKDFSMVAELIAKIVVTAEEAAQIVELAKSLRRSTRLREQQKRKRKKRKPSEKQKAIMKALNEARRAGLPAADWKRFTSCQF